MSTGSSKRALRSGVTKTRHITLPYPKAMVEHMRATKVIIGKAARTKKPGVKK